MPIQFKSSWDDGGVADERIAELMRKHDIQTVFYWPVNWQKYNALKQREALSPDAARGIALEFEIGSHGVNHELLTRVPLKIAFAEIATSKQILEDMFQKSITKFCYPRGYFNNDIKGMVKGAGYTEGRTVKVGALDEGKDPFEMPTTVHVGYDRAEYDGRTWLEYAKSKIKDAVEKSLAGEEVTYHMWGHGFELDKYNSWDDLIELLRVIDDIRSQQQ